MKVAGSEGYELISNIAIRLFSKINFLDIYYTYFTQNQKQLQGKNNIGVYYKEKLEYIKPPKFLDLIDGPYPAICCYAYLKNVTTKISESYLIDECPGMKPSQATETILKNPNCFFYPKGDQINQIISTADILARFVDYSSEKSNIMINKHLGKKLKLDENKVKTTCIGFAWINQIRPSGKISLKTSHKYPHPVFVFLIDKNNSAFTSRSKSVVENSPIYKKAQKVASSNGGCVKFFEENDQTLLGDKDFLVVHNEGTKNQAEELINLGCPAKIIDKEYLEKI